MNHKNYIPAFLAALLLAVSSGSYAASVSYVLNQSNALPDNVDYLTVTISDNVEGQLDFRVEIQSPLAALAGENFGIQKFAFNLVGDLLPESHGRLEYEHRERQGQEGGNHYGWENRAARPGWSVREQHRSEGNGEHGGEPYCKLDSVLMADSFILPEGWEVLFNTGKHEEFDVRLQGNGNNREDTLHFAVLGLALEDVLAGFSAHVAGFEFIPGECGVGEDGHEGEYHCERITSAYFFGDRPVVVPLPATVWLLGSGLLGLSVIARRRGRKV